jgi:hypothetical protein
MLQAMDSNLLSTAAGQRQTKLEFCLMMVLLKVRNYSHRSSVVHQRKSATFRSSAVSSGPDHALRCFGKVVLVYEPVKRVGVQQVQQLEKQAER